TREAPRGDPAPLRSLIILRARGDPALDGLDFRGAELWSARRHVARVHRVVDMALIRLSRDDDRMPMALSAVLDSLIGTQIHPIESLGCVVTADAFGLENRRANRREGR